jgi:hypothetical protein
MIEEIFSTRAGWASAATEGARRGRPRWWLIAKTEGGGVEFLTTTTRDEDGEETLPIFGYEEEAKMFLHMGGYGDDGWSARESSSSEIISVLCGPCSGAEGVALDPLPVMVADGTLCLDWLGRERFLGWLLACPQ